MMRILVVQTTRMGDVIQTSPLIARVRERYPDAHLAVLVRRMGEGVAKRHPAVDEVLVYDEDEIYVNAGARDSDRLLHAYEIADKRIRELRDMRFDLAYNLTHSITSAMFLKLIGIPKVVGAHLSDEGQYVLRGKWTNYFFTSVFQREYSNLNLCDISRHFEPEGRARALVLEVEAKDRAAVDELLRAKGISDDAPLFCMQLGASEENKRWSEAHFARLARMLADRHGARILLVGVREEAPLGEIFEREAPGLAVPLYGETNIPQLAALLERARLLVTNDTGTMHVAAAVNCPVALVSVGHVHYRETGPYGEGHCAIERRRDNLGTGHHVPGGVEERTLLQPEQVLRAVEAVLACRATGAFPEVEDSGEMESVDLFMTRFAPDGCLEYYPLIRRCMGRRDFVRTAYRCMWLEHLRGAVDEAGEQESLERLLRRYSGPGPDEMRAWAAEFESDFAGLAAIARRGVDCTQRLVALLDKRGSMSTARDLIAALMRTDEEARIYSELHPVCRPLALIARFERDNLEGADPRVLAETTLEIYRACAERAESVGRKCRRIAVLAVGNTGIS